MEIKNINENNKTNDKEECFVIMPISNQDGYENGHFSRVYEDIFKPAIEKAGFKPFRVDDSKSSNVIHVNIIKRLIEAPMAICDLSTKNPNVMYELGIRQAFDKPVVLVGDNNPGEIFDINGINTHQYSKGLYYGDVIKDQNTISEMIRETYNSHKEGNEFNSLISIIKINAAVIKTDDKVNESDLIRAMYNDVLSMKSDINKLKNQNNVSLRENQLLNDNSKYWINFNENKEENKNKLYAEQLVNRLDYIKMSEEDFDIKLRKCLSMLNNVQKSIISKNSDKETTERLLILREDIENYISYLRNFSSIEKVR